VLEGARHPRPVGDVVFGHALQQEGGAFSRAAPAIAAACHLVHQLLHPAGTVPHHHAPLGRLVEPGDAIEDGGLAGALGPDQGGDVAAANLEGQVVYRDQPPETHGQMLDGENRIALPVAAALTRAGHHCNLFAGHDQCPSPCATRSAPIRFFSFSTAVGSRVDTNPRGFQAMMSTIARPKMSIRYWVGSKSGPKTAFRKARLRSTSMPPMITTDAITTPICDPRPLRTTIARMIADSRKVKLSGEMNPCRVAKKEPANPPNMAPIAKAVSFVLVVLMP